MLGDADPTGGRCFHRQFPGGERVPTLAEVKEIQRRLNALGFDTGGIDGRTGSDTVKAVLAFEKKVGMQPADGYIGLKVLARLRQGGVIRLDCASTPRQPAAMRGVRP